MAIDDGIARFDRYDARRAGRSGRAENQNDDESSHRPGEYPDQPITLQPSDRREV